MKITDSQVHLWEAHRPGRPWPDEYVAEKVFVAMPGARAHREEPLEAPEWIATMDAAGVDRAVIVPPSPVGDENLTGLEAALAHPTRLAVMGRFNPEAAGARERLEGWLGQPGMVGIRLTFHKQKWQRWLDDPEFDWFWDGCERLAIPLMIFVPGLLDRVPGIVRHRPGLTLILDHMARQSALRDDACFADLDKLLALAAFPNVAIKVSSAPCYSTEPYPFANIAPYLARIHETFGPRRQMWGSDYTRLQCTYQECVDQYLHGLDFLSEDDKRWIMGETAATLLRWPQGAAS